MKRIILVFLDFFFTREILLPFNTIMLKLFIRFIGYNNHRRLMYSKGEKMFLNKVCKDNPQLCIDIGANRGEYSRYILDRSNSKVVAFEPMPKSFNVLKSLTKKYNKRFFAYNIGLGDKNESKKLFFNHKNLEWANFDSELRKIDYLKNSKKSIKCKISSLDEFVKKNKSLINKKIDLIKIDTEGYEFEVLMGSKKIIKKFKPKYIQLEYNWHHLFKNKNLYSFSKILQNYQAFRIFPYGDKLVKINPEKPENNYFNYSNIVFIRK